MQSVPDHRPIRRRLIVGGVAAGCVIVALAVIRPTPTPPDAGASPPAGKSEPQILFDKWPAGREPDLVLVLTGQMHGYLQKCGCSNPQKGGLERRYNFIESLKAKGWDVIALDVGDVPRPLAYTPTPQQTLTKYEVAMQAMKLMGYKAVTVGKEELSMPLLDALTRYSVQKGNEYPRVHAANISNREDFPGTEGSTLFESDILTSKSGLSVGVVGVAGAELVQKGVDRTVKYAGNAGTVVNGVLQKWKLADKNPNVNVLLYQGSLEWKDPATGKNADAQTAAAGLPEFHIILCKTPDDADAPTMPTVVNEGRTMICQVGQKGQNVGVIGVYKGEKGIELYYQKVIMTEEFETPADKEAGHPLLKLLQDYSDTVKDNDYLSEMARRKKLHPAQAQFKQAAYMGDTHCIKCHEGEYAEWSKSKHAHAYDALAKIAKHPTGRQFDGECIICHTVGYDYHTGYLNEKATPTLKNVQCESCHGPGNLHVVEESANLGKRERNQTHQFAGTLSPWKVEGKGAMPTVAKLNAMMKEKDVGKRQEMLNEAENRVYLNVYQTCAKCHDIENDPKFDLSVYWPTVVHSGLKKKK